MCVSECVCVSNSSYNCLYMIKCFIVPMLAERVDDRSGAIVD